MAECRLIRRGSAFHEKQGLDYVSGMSAESVGEKALCMGRYSTLLAPAFADFAGLSEVQNVLDVGCGPGALTAELVARLGAPAVSAVDPSEPFVAAIAERYPDVTVRLAPAEELPFEDASFDAALAQLVVHFMSSSLESGACPGWAAGGRVGFYRKPGNHAIVSAATIRFFLNYFSYITR